MTIVNDKILEPDTIDEFVEAAKIFDHDNDGKIEVAELRYAMSRLGDVLEESTVDELIAELDKDKTGFIEIVEWAKQTFKWSITFSTPSNQHTCMRILRTSFRD